MSEPDKTVVVVGGSAGATAALMKLTAALPADFAASTLIAVHMRAGTESRLEAVLGRSCRLPVDRARDRAPLVPGRVTVSVPDRHLMLVDNQIRVVRGPKENGARPAIDALFRSAALAHGPAVIGVLLSGMLDCGSRGLADVHRLGGITLVQEPSEAEWPDMPKNAIESVAIDHVLPVAGIAEKLVELSRAPRLARTARPPLPGELQAGTPTGLTCPACGGALWDLVEANLDRYVCHTGHRYARDVLCSEKDDEVERALFAALRGFHESTALGERLAQRARERGDQRAADVHRGRIEEIRQHTRVLLTMIDDLAAEKN